MRATPGRRRTAGGVLMRPSEGTFRALLDAAPDAIVAVDADGLIVLANRRAEALFGYGREELLGQPVEIVVPDSVRAAHPALRARYAAGPRPRPMGAGLQLAARRKDGTEFPVDVSLSAVETGDGLIVSAAVRDVTDRIEAEAERERLHALAERERFRAELRGAQQFRAVLESSPVPTAISRLVDGRIVYANEAMADAVGWPRHEMVGRTAVELDLWADPADRQQLVDEVARNGRVYAVEARLRRRNGEVFPVITSSESVEFDGERCLLGMSYDISQRVRAEQALRTSQAQLKTFMDHLPAPAYLKGVDGRYLVVNEAAASLFGRTPEAVVGRTNHEVLPAALADDATDRDRAVLSTRAPLQEELSFTAGDGQRRWMLSTRFPVVQDGRVVAVGGIATDITERQRLEREAREAAERARLLLDSTAEGIFGVDRDGRCTFVNRAAAEALGRPADELVGAHIHDVAHHRRADGSPYPWEECPTHRTLHTGEATRPDGEVLWRADGSSFPIEYDSHPVRVGGAIVGAVVSFSDITERTQWAAALEAAREEALEVARLKSDFLATMSHEIRTPMNGVIGMTGLLLDTDLDEEQREFAETVRNSAQALLTIINDILDFSKIEAGGLELEETDFDIEATAEEVGELLAETAHRKNLELAVFVDPVLPPSLRGDPGRIRQVLTNLVSNAVKFTASGEVVVTAGVAGYRGGAVVVRFEVRDTGIGIPAEARDRLFESFTQADASTTRRYGGTGLGLAICRRLVALMRGEIGVESDVGKGSTFWFTVPLGLGRGSRAPLRRADVAGARVLVVDDAEVNRVITGALLRSWGLDVIAVGGGDEALREAGDAAAAGRAFDLVVTDFQMPGMDGVDLADAMAAALEPLPPVIVLSSAGGREEARGRAGPNCAAFLVKPARRSQLFDAVSSALGAPPSRPRRAGAAHVARAAGATRARVLVADDNPVNQRLAALLLERMGYSVDTVGDGAEALDALGRIAYDAVVMDCEMPVLDGYAAAAEIRRREGAGRRTPIVAVTASALRTDVDRALAAGMDAHVAKPVDRDVLAATLDRLLGPGGGRDPLAAGAGYVGAREAGDREAGDLEAGDGERHVLDPAAVGALRELLDDDGFRGLAGMFIREAPSRTERLTAAVADGDVAEVANAAHRLTGSAGAFGVTRVAALSRAIEQEARQGRLPEPAAVAELLAAVAAATDALVREAGPPPG